LVADLVGNGTIARGERTWLARFWLLFLFVGDTVAYPAPVQAVLCKGSTS
jgi:hypothetical protein